MKSRGREAMGGLMKGHPHGNNGGGSRGRLYGLMLLLAFGVAVIGVMLLHRFRERRFFNLLVKEKDSELTSLHLLLQKERDNAKEAKWKLEAMKAKIHTLRAQKRELDNRISEMHSTISSLKEEQNTIELTLEEKQDEIKLLRGKRTGINSESSQIQALSDILKQKESEIEDLNHRLESPVKVWSVSSDDPSNASVDLHRKTRMPERDESNANEGEQSAAKLNDSISHEIRGYSTDHADSSRRESANNQSDGHERQHNNKGENGGETVESREIVGEESEKAGNSKESSLEHGNKDIEERTAEGAKKNSDESQKEWQEKDTMKMGAFDNSDSEAQRHQDEGRHTTEKKVLETTGDGLSEKTSNAQGGENQEFGRNYIGGMKSEILRNSHIRQYLKGNHGNLKRAKEKRRSTLARIMENRGNYESNGLAVRRDRVSFESTLPRDCLLYTSFV